ncbi:hypothetical protein AALO_G00226660 [Alosa alosa]|uniref:Uncharacterized protein n=1 Tax=Alosa alosa TaxID=278164 RepID=A0AAV6G1P6_9TELE|nr:hypothetical protein AALO_G00226660 [Alosa alosa]
MLSKVSAPIIKADAFLIVVIVVIERLLEKEFNCPCNQNNAFFCNVLVACSSLIFVSLTVLIQIPHYKKLQKCCDCSLFNCLFGICLSALISVFSWYITWYFDGHYYVCKMSTWDGVWTKLGTIPSQMVQAFRWQRDLHRIAKNDVCNVGP